MKRMLARLRALAHDEDVPLRRELVDLAELTADVIRGSIFGSDCGDTAASTLPGAACTAGVTMPDGKRTDLGARTADQQGTVAWNYPSRSPAPQGMGYHTITCRLGGQSATGSLLFEVGG